MTVLQQFISDPEKLRLFQQERLAIRVADLMCKVMEEKQITRTQLAEQLNKTKGRISQILSGDSNLTLRTVADVFTAIGKNLSPFVEKLSQKYSVLQPVNIENEIKPLEDLPWQEMFSLEPSGEINIAA